MLLNVLCSYNTDTLQIIFYYNFLLRIQLGVINEMTTEWVIQASQANKSNTIFGIFTRNTLHMYVSICSFGTYSTSSYHMYILDIYSGREGAWDD